jgi:sterol desaturase/sphingolipid hydroxylase (fatty acid hydroxylase superfamily)
MADRKRFPAIPVLAVAGMAALILLERRAPLRRQTQREPVRSVRNLLMGALSMAVVALAEGPLVSRLADVVERRRWGLVQRLNLPTPLRDVLAILGLDYTMYVWHVLTHEVPSLWRFHLVHHVDLDLDSTTALRFHAVDMLISIPWRAAQVVVLGASPSALAAWQGFFFASVMFHHSNLRLPARLERLLAAVLTTPRMHGIHHSAVRDETDSNWSSGLSLWDHLHGTFRMDVAQREIRIGVPACRDPSDTRLGASLAMPFRRQRDAWVPRSF